MLQCASRALSLPLERIHLCPTNSQTTHYSTGTAGSTGTDFNGPAVINACEKIVERLRPFREAAPEAGWDAWVTMAWAEQVNMDKKLKTDLLC